MNDMTQTHFEPCEIVLTDAERQRCEIWTRVMGYHRPVASFNIGKKGEFHERRFFEEERAGLGGAEHMGRAGAQAADSTAADLEMSCRRPGAGLGGAEHMGRAGAQAADSTAADLEMSCRRPGAGLGGAEHTWGGQARRRPTPLPQALE